MGEVIKKPVFTGSSEYIANPFSGFANTGLASITVTQNFCIKYTDINNFVFYQIALQFSLNGVFGIDSGTIAGTFSESFIDGVCVVNTNLAEQNNNLCFISCNQPDIEISYHVDQNAVIFINGTLYYQ